MKRKILVAGLGLIGGSLALAMKKSPENHILGFDLQKETLQIALEEQIIDESYTNFEEAVKQAKIVILAAPISETIKLMKKMDTIELNHDIILSDVSSVKGSILQAANEMINNRITFIGGHPMAGSHKAGIQAAKGHLFENAIYVLTPTTSCSNGKIEVLKEVLKETKSNFLILNPEEHDEMTSVISHFPHLIASSLVHQAKKWEQMHQYLPELAAGGFRDITRIASSNPKMWQDIFQHNGEQMSRLLQDWINEMVTLKEFLDKNNKEEMIVYLDQAKKYRDGLGEKTTRGALPSFYDVYVDVKDQPGAIASVVQLLADEEISIRNIRILEIRDSINGALRLSVTNQKDQQRAYNVLKNNNYDVTIEA
ncbi:prephenate dehydrogenase [Pseudogracilibacillus sp. SE30717A]|uniref:prephenate dehydrogenase n=1 Tax=Pseudogracilibacillus sp. SE30717A TaxID=3098293 RepID=UPI00300E65D2